MPEDTAADAVKAAETATPAKVIEAPAKAPETAAAPKKEAAKTADAAAEKAPETAADPKADAPETAPPEKGTGETAGSETEVDQDKGDQPEPRRWPPVLVGVPVQFHEFGVPHGSLASSPSSHGPHAATVTRILREGAKGRVFVDLYVIPSRGDPYHARNVPERGHPLADQGRYWRNLSDAAFDA